MKATEYFAKYDDILTKEMGDKSIGESSGLTQLAQEFMAEAGELAETRHIRKASSLGSLLKEQNDKWNKLVRLFTLQHGFSPIKTDGFLRLTDNLLKEMAARQEEVKTNGGDAQEKSGQTNSSSESCW